MNDFEKAIQALQENIKLAKQSAEWLWGLLQGDFNESQTPAQVITNAGISIAVSSTGVGLIVAWLLDLRDFCACVYHIYKAGNKSGSFNVKDVSPTLWIGLAIMIIGLVPVVGDVLKGVLRIIYLQFIRLSKTMSKSATRLIFRKSVESALPYVDDLLAHEKIRKFLKKKGWARPYRELANELKKNYKQLTSPDQIIIVFDLMMQRSDKVFNECKKYLPRSAEKQYQTLKNKMLIVRDGFKVALKNNTQQLKELIEEMIIAFEKRDSALYKAVSGKMSTHYYGRIKTGTKAYNEAKKLPFLKKSGKYSPLDPEEVSHSQYFSRVKKYSGTKTSLDVGDWTVETFDKTLRKRTITGPTKLYRVVDPGSSPDGFHWVTEDVFKSLKNRNDWRDKLAVKVDWNANGQYVTMEIPAKESLEVWSGKAASQPFDEDNLDLNKWYEGGAEQIVFNPTHSGYQISKRQETQWGYVDNDQQLLSSRVVIYVDGSTPKQ